MRKGSAAIVPLFIGIMLLFWAIMFLGSGGDTLHSVNKVENLNHLQTKLLHSALKKRDEEIRKLKAKNSSINKSLADAEANKTVNKYIRTVMYNNNIDTKLPQ